MTKQLNAVLVRRMQAESDLSMADFEVLVQLTDKADGRVRYADLAGGLAWEKSRLSHHIARMQRRGLVDRQICPTDGRGAFVAVTPQGRRAIERAAPRHVETVRELVFDTLSGEQVWQLRAIADRVLAGLADEPPAE
ncbi:MAG: MarR family winged helix-turn-helix transcriptional regulator [Thermocrispum sp.]